MKLGKALKILNQDTQQMSGKVKSRHNSLKSLKEAFATHNLIKLVLTHVQPCHY